MRQVLYRIVHVVTLTRVLILDSISLLSKYQGLKISYPGHKQMAANSCTHIIHLPNTVHATRLKCSSATGVSDRKKMLYRIEGKDRYNSPSIIRQNYNVPVICMKIKRKSSSRPFQLCYQKHRFTVQTSPHHKRKSRITCNNKEILGYLRSLTRNWPTVHSRSPGRHHNTLSQFVLTT